MTRSPTIRAARERTAIEAFDSLGGSPSKDMLLAVQCARGHHVAAVYATPQGRVFVSLPRAHAHGRRDRHDAAHHGGHRDQPWVDWIEPAGSSPGNDVSPDDPLPAGCECGPRSLSRSLLLQAMTERVPRMVID
jgi:hypothetical protein